MNGSTRCTAGLTAELAQIRVLAHRLTGAKDLPAIQSCEADVVTLLAEVHRRTLGRM